MTDSAAMFRPLPWLALAAWLAAMALLVPLSHDEDQYVAAALLVARGLRPFNDFMYLQTPLQLALTGAVAAATPGWTLIALRLTNAALGLAALVGVYGAQQQWGVSARTAAWTSALMAASVPFAFGAAVARNDALPTALLAAALWLTAGTTGRRPIRLALTGLALGLAASAKISFAVPLGAGAIWLLWCAAAVGGWRGAFAWSAGGLTGLLPSLATYAVGPDAFRYGVLTFATTSSPTWYRLNGLEHQLTFAGKLGDGLWALAQGPALAALALLTLAIVSGRTRFTLVCALLIGGLIGAWLPTPTYKQYFITALPPLFVALGMAAPRLPRWSPWLLNLFALLGAAGLVYAGARDWRRNGAPAALAVTSTAHDIGDRMHAAGATGMIVTLSAARVADSGYPLDPRFAAGASGFRTADLRTPADLTRWHLASPHTLAAALAIAPPAAILTGYEGASSVNVLLFPDASLDAWARLHGWQAQRLANGRGLLWLPSQVSAQRRTRL